MIHLHVMGDVHIQKLYISVFDSQFCIQWYGKRAKQPPKVIEPSERPFVMG